MKEISNANLSVGSHINHKRLEESSENSVSWHQNHILRNRRLGLYCLNK